MLKYIMELSHLHLMEVQADNHFTIFRVFYLEVLLPFMPSIKQSNYKILIGIK